MTNAMLRLAETDVVYRDHWQPNGAFPKCYFENCATIFNVINRHHHCRECGYVFCSKHVKFVKRLDPFTALPSPTGVLVKVCPSCYEKQDEIEASRGIYRDRTQLFREERTKSKKFCDEKIRGTLDRIYVVSIVPSANTGSSQSSQKAVYCENTFCNAKFSFFEGKKECKLCQKALCKKCCSFPLSLAYNPILNPAVPEAHKGATVKICLWCDDWIQMRLRTAEFERAKMEMPNNIPSAVLAYQMFASIRQNLNDKLPDLAAAIKELSDKIEAAGDHPIALSNLSRDIEKFGKKEEDECSKLLDMMLANHAQHKQIVQSSSDPASPQQLPDRESLTNQLLLRSMASSMQALSLKFKALQAERRALFAKVRQAKIGSEESTAAVEIPETFA
eukprot:c93_g1_i1.p1 GENE.c93_g1_i1~~c93_g1_i1.p1  ORF type:complete len:390 (+),score=68.34 c93_g1_i1:720-1889(+)